MPATSLTTTKSRVAAAATAAAAVATIATATADIQQRQQQQRQRQQQLKNHQQKSVNGFPTLALGTILIAVNILNCFAILQTNALNISTSTAENHTAVRQNLQQQQQLHPQQQQQQQQQQQKQLEQHQQQNQLLAAIEKTLTVNHTLQSFSIIDVTRTGAAAAAAVIGTEAEVDKQPVFDFGMPRNITARTGQAEATIRCRVDHLNDKSVSWIRKRDLHILTVATSSYTSDKRFEATQTKDAREWTLHVKAPQPRDSGIYECQVNTEPKMSMAFQLNIIVTSPDAKAVISGPPDLHFKVGSAIILNCIVQQPSFKDIGPIYWYRGEQMLTPLHKQLEDENDAVADDADADDDDVAVTAADANAVAADGQSNRNSVDDVERDITNDITRDFITRIAMETQLGDTLKSRLRISNAQTTDTGNYTCQPTTASSASIMVHVINDENPAAMQKSRAPALCPAINIIAVAVTITITNITTKVTPLHCWLSTIAVVAVAIVVHVLAVNSDVDFVGGGGHIRLFLFAVGTTFSMGKWAICFLCAVTRRSIKTPIRIMQNFSENVFL